MFEKKRAPRSCGCGLLPREPPVVLVLLLVLLLLPTPTRLDLREARVSAWTAQIIAGAGAE
jgi:hypothetical protein